VNALYALSDIKRATSAKEAQRIARLALADAWARVEMVRKPSEMKLRAKVRNVARKAKP
jgi:hypothetical protein